jgi:hypothetical protein
LISVSLAAELDFESFGMTCSSKKTHGKQGAATQSDRATAAAGRNAPYRQTPSQAERDGE